MTMLPKDTREWVDTFKGHVVMHMLGTLTNGEFERAIRAPDGTMNVTVTINGREFDFDVFLAYVEQQMDGMIDRAAGELVKEKLYAILDPVSTLMSDVERLMKDRLGDALKHDPWER